MRCRLRHPRFNLHKKLPLDYLIHGFDGWGWVYYPRVASKGPTLMRFLVIKKKKIRLINYSLLPRLLVLFRKEHHLMHYLLHKRYKYPKLSSLILKSSEWVSWEM
jgi:hypothetical protein